MCIHPCHELPRSGEERGKTPETILIDWYKYMNIGDQMHKLNFSVVLRTAQLFVGLNGA